MATVRKIVNDALALIGEVAGAGVAEYSEDVLFDNAVRAFNMLFTKYNWDEFITWGQFTLDGITGFAPDGTFDGVRNFEDFIAFYPGSSRTEIPILPKKTNPYSLSTSATRTAINYWSSLSAKDANFDKKRIQFWPKASTATITYCIKEYPVNVTEGWDWDDDMILDPDMIVHGVAYISLISDETNAGAAETQRGLMEDRFSTIMKALSDRPIGRSPVSGWRESP